MSALPPIAKIAELLGGDVAGGQVLCPGPGHTDDNRSLSVKPDHNDREGFVTHSFAGDDWKACRDHVRRKLGLSEPKKQNKTGSGVWTTLAEFVYLDEAGDEFLKVKKCRDPKGKRQFVQYHWEKNGWVKGKPKGPKVPYRLMSLKAAPKTATIFFVEGEKDADALAKIGFVATTASEGSSAKWDPALTKHFTGRNVTILPDADKTGRAHGLKVASAIHGVAAAVRVVDLYPDRHDGADVSDWIASDTAGVKLAKLVKEAEEWEPSGPATSADDAGPDEDESADTVELRRLAQLPPLQYERERKEAAKRLGITRVAMLDMLVRSECEALGLGDADDGLQGRPISFPDPEMWPTAVDGAALLDDIAKAIGAHVIMPETSRDACALWVPHTFSLDATMISPRLAITSPTRGCGKTTLLDVISQLVLRPLPAANVSASATFRVVEGYRPCLLIDEADSFLKDNEELRGVLNSGHRKGGSVLRTVGDDHEPRSFSTYSACAIALIGQLPGTLADRSVPITLTRRKRDETITPFRLDRVEHLVVLARRLARWTADNAVAIAATEPEMPAGLYNRAADNWRPLLAIATVAGGKWLERGQAAALASVAAEIDDASRLELLLGDIREIFAKQAADKIDPADEIASGELVKVLVGLDARPWAELGKSRKPLTANRLARMLKEVKVAPEQIGPEKNRVRGYRLEHFQDAFDRYLPPEGASQPSSRPERDEIRTSDVFEPSSPDDGWTDAKCEKPNNDGPLDGWTVEKGGQGQEHAVCDYCGRPGGLVEVSYSDGPRVLLHRECEGAYRRRLDQGEDR